MPEEDIIWCFHLWQNCWSKPYVSGGLPDFVRLLISRRVNWMGRVVSMGEKRNAYSILVE